MKNNKKGNATVYLIIIALLAITVTAIVIAVLLILFLMIRYNIRKAKKEKEREQARLERERFEQERIAAGGKPSTLGDGRFEAADVSEIAGKAMDKIDDFLEGGE